MATAAFEKNKVVITPQSFKPSRWNFARWCTAPLRNLPKVKNLNFTKIQDGELLAFWKQKVNCYISAVVWAIAIKLCKITYGVTLCPGNKKNFCRFEHWLIQPIRWTACSYLYLKKISLGSIRNLFFVLCYIPPQNLWLSSQKNH